MDKTKIKALIKRALFLTLYTVIFVVMLAVRCY